MFATEGYSDWLDNEQSSCCAEPGKYCGQCDEVHCSVPEGHKYNENDYCIYCGADGRM